MHESDTTAAQGGDEGQSRFAAGWVFAGRYRIVNLLGRGGMGEVYSADDLKVGQRVAIKVLAVPSMRDSPAVERFVREVRLARGIAHPNVCRVYDIGEADGWQYLSMEYVDGETLRSLLRRIGRLPRAKAYEIAYQLCAGLAAAHEQGVLHRDLKPDNIMIDGRGRVRVMDFGLAVPSDVSIYECAGTPGYMAPEQLVGARVTERTDVYALGLLLYELFVGERLFDRDVTGVAERAARWHAAQEQLDPAVRRVVAQCLESDPVRRPPAVAPIAAALDPGAASVEIAGGSGLRPSLAWAALAATIIGTFLLAANPESFTVAASDVPTPPEVLAERARAILVRSRVALKPIDWEFWFAPPRIGQAQPIRFVYRQSAAYLIPTNLFHVVTEEDPPTDVAGMATVILDPHGRLLSFAAVVDGMAGGANAPATDWQAWFADAGLNEGDFERVDSSRAPPVAHDARLSWRRSGLDVSAATLANVPVFFEVGESAERGPSPRNVLLSRRSVPFEILLWIVIVTIFAIASMLARRNLRSRTNDRSVARKLAVLIGCGGAVFAVLRAHHVPLALDELTFLLGVTGWILVWTAFTWIVYVAVEPHVRELWPQMLPAWTRLFSGHYGDPQVGRDVLAGLLTAVGVALLHRVTADLLNDPRSPVLVGPALESLRSSRHLVAALAYHVTDAIQFALGGVFMLVLLRLMVRVTWVAATLWILLATIVNTTSVAAVGTAIAWPNLALTVAVGVLMFNVVVRLGLVAVVASLVAERLVVAMPLTLHMTAWFAESSLAIILLVCAVAAYAFVVSLGDRPALGV